MRLETPEDIAAWLAERKRKWPGSKNAQLLAEREAKRRKYEESSPANLAAVAASAKKGKGKAVERDERGNMVWRAPAPGVIDRPVASAAPSAPVQAAGASGSSAHADALTGGADPQIEQVDEPDDDEDEQVAAALVNKPAPSTAAPISAAVDAAATRSAQDAQPDDDGNDSDCDSEAAPEEAPIDRHLEVQLSPSRSPSPEPVAPAAAQKPCRDWQTTGSCRFGARCRYSHSASLKGRVRPAPPVQQPEAQKDDMIGKLLYNEVRREISDLVQVIDFLARNAWLENTELRPGMKEEAENRIKVIRSNGVGGSVVDGMVSENADQTPPVSAI